MQRPFKATQVKPLVTCFLLSVAAMASCQAGRPAATPPPVVDEPLGARYSLGMTLWHMGHSAEMIGRFHEYLRNAALTPAELLPAQRLAPPATMQRILLDPELLAPEQLNGWQVAGDLVTSAATDAGPTFSMPLHIPRTGMYRLWVRYYADPGSTGVTFLKIYRAGQEHLGPVMQGDEVYDQPPEQAGFAWKDLLVDLEAGDYTVRMGHVTRWWHGSGGYNIRRLDCLYLTEELWAEAPTPEALEALRRAATPQGPQRTVEVPLSRDQADAWQWWQVRPLSWEEAAANPRLFALSREFWQGVVSELAAKEYSEEKDKLPNYRAPQRQVVFNETWNMVANPVRAQRQIRILMDDVRREPLGYNYVWHDVATNVPDLTSPDRPASYGGWSYAEGCLFASWGNPTGTVATEVPVRKPGRYSVWVLSSSTNLSYTAPWFGTVSVAGKEQFKYHHAGKIPSVWMKMGEAQVDEPGPVRVEFTLDDSGYGGTYRRVYTLFLVDDPNFVPRGTVRPPWTLETYRERAAEAGARPDDRYLLWVFDNPYTPLSQEVWADKTTSGKSWPERPVTGPHAEHELLMARDTCRAVQLGLRNLTDRPLTLQVSISPLEGAAGSFPGAVTWRVVAFAPYGPDRQAWTPFFLLRRPDITVPPLNVAGVWLTVDARDLAPGQYTSTVHFSSAQAEARTVTLRVRVSAVEAKPQQPVLVDGYTQPHEGEAYLRDFVEHRMRVWRGEMSKADMQKWGIRLLGIQTWQAADFTRLKELGLDYSDWFCPIMDEPSGKTEEELKPFLDIAKAIRAADPKVRISFNPGEAATLETFQVLAPYCDFWLPYALHLSEHWGGPQKWAIYKAKPWMWYTTPCLWDKSPDLPNGIYHQIRQVPSQTGQCVGTAFFALNYPWRDQWDTAYEHIPDASTMGAVMSRHGPVPTRTWEAIREAIQHADLAMLVRERLGARAFEDVQDPDLRKLISEGSCEELIRWLETHS